MIRMLDDFLFAMREKVVGIQICDNNPHVLVYVEGVSKPFRLKPPEIVNDENGVLDFQEMNHEDQEKWACDMFQGLQCQMSTGYTKWSEYHINRDEIDLSDEANEDIGNLITKYGVGAIGAMELSIQIDKVLMREALNTR